MFSERTHHRKLGPSSDARSLGGKFDDRTLEALDDALAGAPHGFRGCADDLLRELTRPWQRRALAALLEDPTLSRFPVQSRLEAVGRALAFLSSPQAAHPKSRQVISSSPGEYWSRHTHHWGRELNEQAERALHEPVLRKHDDPRNSARAQETTARIIEAHLRVARTLLGAEEFECLTGFLRAAQSDPNKSPLELACNAPAAHADALLAYGEREFACALDRAPRLGRTRMTLEIQRENIRRTRDAFPDLVTLWQSVQFATRCAHAITLPLRPADNPVGAHYTAPEFYPIRLFTRAIERGFIPLPRVGFFELAEGNAAAICGLWYGSLVPQFPRPTADGRRGWTPLNLFRHDLEGHIAQGEDCVLEVKRPSPFISSLHPDLDPLMRTLFWAQLFFPSFLELKNHAEDAPSPVGFLLHTFWAYLTRERSCGVYSTSAELRRETLRSSQSAEDKVLANLRRRLRSPLDFGQTIPEGITQRDIDRCWNSAKRLFAAIVLLDDDLL